MRDGIELKGGMVLEDKEGIRGLVTVTNIGTLVGWQNGNTSNFGEVAYICDIYKDNEIVSVYEITEEHQILGRSLTVNSMNHIWTKPTVISNTDDLVAWAKANNVDVSNVIIGSN